MIDRRFVPSVVLCAAVVAAGCAPAAAPVATIAPPPVPNSSTSTATPPPTQSPSPNPVALSPGETLLGPGTYAAEFQGYRYTVSIAGKDWATLGKSDARFFSKGSDTDPGWSAGLFIYGVIADLYADACHWTTPIVPGPKVDDFATALAAMNGFEVSGPTDVTVAGYHGKRIRLTVPVDAKLGDCRDGQYRSFGGRYAYRPGQVEDIRVMDLDGTRHLFFTMEEAGTPGETRAALDRMAESLEITPSGG